MKTYLIPTATLSAILLAMFTSSTNGKRPQAPTERPQTGRDSTAQIRIQGSLSGTNKPAEPCGKKVQCDPAFEAGGLAESEATIFLKMTICKFLSEYRTAASEMATALRSAISPAKNYCVFQSARESLASSSQRPFQIDLSTHPKIIIAVLPDPIHSQLARRFDESVDELQNSFQDLGWIYDRAWLPWDNKLNESPANFDQRIKNEYSQREYEQLPGVILFRTDPGKDTRQPLIVLVVGDRPTSGLNAEQFNNAIAIWKQFTGWDDYLKQSTNAEKSTEPSDASTLLIIGPTYSGSTTSLNSLLSRLVDETVSQSTPCQSKDFRVFIASGTISSSSGLSEIARSYDDCKRVQIAPVSFAVDKLYEDRLIFRFLDAHLGADKGECKVGVLSEAESAFGTLSGHIDEIAGAEDEKERSEGLIAKIDDALSKRKFRAEVKQHLLDLRAKLSRMENEAIQNLQRYGDDDRYFARIRKCHFYFPREISKLRSAYEQGNIFGFNSSSNSIHTQLHLSLGGTENEDDTVHTFAGPEDAASMEAAMASLAAELERKATSIVLLSATDVLDEIFVTRYLSQHAPNVTVIVTDTDRLFLRGDETSMANAYVVAPWPLLAGNEEWSAPSAGAGSSQDSQASAVRLHDSAGGQGLYAATRFLICQLSQMPLKQCDGSGNYGNRVSIPEYQVPIHPPIGANIAVASRPPLWLSYVGRGGFWPISLLDAEPGRDGLWDSSEFNLPSLERDGGKPQATGTQRPAFVSRGIVERDPRGITIITCIIGLFLGFHGLACMRARLDRGFAWSYALAENSHHRWRLLLQIAIALAAIPALVLLKVPIELGVHIRTFYWTALNVSLQSLAVLLTVRPLMLITGGWPWPGGFKARLLAVTGLGLGLFAETAFVLACNRFLWEIIAPPAPILWTERAFFIYRSGHLFSGIAPTLPILLLCTAVIIYLISLFERLMFSMNRIPQLPECGEADLYCPGPKKIERLNFLLCRSWDNWRLGLLATVTILLALFLFGLHDSIPRSIMHGHFDKVVIALSALVLFLFIYDFVTALLAWFLLRSDCLLVLSRSPLRWGFTWIKGWSWQRIWTPGAMSPYRVFDYLGRLSEANHRAMKDPDLDAAFRSMRQQFEGHPRDAVWAIEVTTRLGELHRKLASSGTKKLAELALLYAQDHGPITGSEEIERGLGRDDPQEKREGIDPSPRMSFNTLDREAKEEFVALIYLGYIRMVLLQIRSRILTATGMYTCLLLALTSYPFLNHHYIVIGLSCLLVAMASAVILIYSQMHRDEILRRTTETTSGKWDPDFFVKIISVVGIPLLTLIASQFPEVSNLLFSWLEPGLSSMK